MATVLCRCRHPEGSHPEVSCEGMVQEGALWVPGTVQERGGCVECVECTRYRATFVVHDDGSTLHLDSASA